ncbi:hypothetical protein LTR78_003845 [Recurvomyces mirabilis]|uniref:Uncharacterized protein n=1 Tax=Recurvomyces mirabilis TaxID=574656 RepID=A0AAE0WQK7_9PEZI|nr:hypothetical protein LTR78_003845 [Recurvomyces mirabilis]KAK5154016.1 hypothetical protein LTS14_007236 [Recurvomyces mirabilis]
MISNLDIPDLRVFCAVDQKLAALNRELRFIARTLARLRHRHHAALVFSSSSSSSSNSKQSNSIYTVTELQQNLQKHSVEMLKRLFITPKKERQDDIESAPTTPVDENPPPCLSPPDSRPASTARRSVTERPQSLQLLAGLSRTYPASAPSSRPTSYHEYTSPPRPASYAAPSQTDTITLLVDQTSQAIFTLPRHHLPTISAKFAPKPITIFPNRGSDDPITITAIHLPGITTADLTDFLHWTRTGHILPFSQKPSDPEWHLESLARRLIAALALGITLSSIPYQAAFLREFHALGPSLPWPEDFVNILFAATKLAGCGDHPAEGLMVGLVKAKTMGGNGRKVRAGPRDRNCERGDRIRCSRFWGLFDEGVLGEGDGGEGGSLGDVEEYVSRL